jgi:hypothetical protein
MAFFIVTAEKISNPMILKLYELFLLLNEKIYVISCTGILEGVVVTSLCDSNIDAVHIPIVFLHPH